jgi:hypothetical protein
MRPPTEETVASIDRVLADAEGDAGIVARALFEKGRVLARLGRLRESDAVVTELVERFENDPDPSRRSLVCRALFGRAKDRLSVEDFDRRALVVEYRHILHVADREPPIEALAAEALFHLGLTYAKIAVAGGDADHRERAAARFADLDRRFGASKDPSVQRWVARGAETAALLRESTSSSG